MKTQSIQRKIDLGIATCCSSVLYCFNDIVDIECLNNKITQIRGNQDKSCY